MTIVKGGNWSGAYSRFSFNELKRHLAMLKEMGKPLLDDEFNVLQDILLTELRRAVQGLAGDGSPNSGFLIVGTSAANGFTIKAGTMFVSGLRIAIPADVTYATQESPGPALSPPSSGVRTDTVYLDVWLDEVGPSGDASIVDPTLGVETSRRAKLYYMVRVAAGTSPPANGYLDANGQPHYVAALASIVRTTSAAIDAGMVTDLRANVLAPAATAAAIAAHNASGEAHLDASETTRGMIELATEAEVLAGTDAGRAVVPATLKALIDTLSGGYVPIGTSLSYRGGTVPSGYLLEDGAQYRQSDYPELYGVIGGTYGAADAGYFRVPDSRGRTDIGSGQGPGLTLRTLGQALGEEAHALTEAELAAHAHFVANVDNVGQPGSSNTPTATKAIAMAADNNSSTYQLYALGGTSTPATVGLSSSTGGGGAHNNMQPSLVATKIIRYV